MAELGIPELLIILALVLVLIGPGRLAGIGQALGQSIREFRQGVREHEPASEPTADSEERPHA